VLFPQTYGPYRNFLAKKVAKIIIGNAYAIYSRDKESFDIINKLLGSKAENKNIHFCPDVAFTMKSRVPEIISINPPISKEKIKHFIGFNINGLVYNGGYTRNNMFNLNLDYKMLVKEIVEFFLNSEKCNLLLVPHTYTPSGNVNSDPDACKDIFNIYSEEFKDKIYLITGEYDQHDIKGIIGLCDFFIGSRMHACIAALSQNIPTIGIAYSKKFKGVFNSIQSGDYVVDARKVDNKEALKIITERYHESEILKNQLSMNISKAQEEIDKNFKKMIDYCMDGSSNQV
jgi:polysaccharide pyruvyl transferase WcaK-like protein